MRDPKTDPQQGDVLVKSTKTQEVLAVSDGEVFYKCGKRKRKCRIEAWREWARRATVKV